MLLSFFIFEPISIVFIKKSSPYFVIIRNLRSFVNNIT
nr:MAG TPA: hypothetical protein [Caudoviricetes sp.]